ncbi:MAG: hypothetical protein AMXMBFR82_50280 [Candidatus Hydrogenedentota bacterium]
MNRTTLFRVLCSAIMLCASAAFAQHSQRAYNPLTVSDRQPGQRDFDVHDDDRERKIPIRVYLPTDDAPAPVILFSHGLGGSREGCVYLGEHWAKRGYVCVFLQHPGSDTSVWRNEGPEVRMTALQDAANLENYLLRVKDVPAAINQLDAWNQSPDHPLAGRLDLSRVGMSGHSFGAITTQAVSGQSTARGNRAFTDPRIKAAIAFSPSSPRRGKPEQAFGQVAIPWMLMTGTNDVARIGGIDLASRLAVYPALPPGDKYELVLNGAEHAAFTDRALPGDSNPRNPNHHRAILAVSTAFWDAILRDDDAARDWLNGTGPASVLEDGDRWQTK